VPDCLSANFLRGFVAGIVANPTSSETINKGLDLTSPMILAIYGATRPSANRIKLQKIRLRQAS